MRVVTTSEGLAEAGAFGCVLVPTMGALHEGHRALISLARRRAGPQGVVAATIFVNPTQFNERSDFDRYPRDLEVDCALCREWGADVVFAPDPETVYPPAESVPVGELPAVATEPGLEDRYRPGHFAGVCQVVRRLFVLVRPAAAVFGEKDWQQLQVIRAMTAGEGVGVEIVAGETVREPDGLAMSSRNRLLSAEARAAAGAIPRALGRAGEHENAGSAESAMRAELEAAGLTVEYAVVRAAASLGPAVRGRPARALIAARAGGVRLIDNAAWPPG